MTTRRRYVEVEGPIEGGQTLQWDGTKFIGVEAGSGPGATDHGTLTGLSDDDHPQYHNDTRGDARYSQLGHTHAQLHDAATVADTDTIDLTLTGQQISGAVRLQHSLTSDAFGVRLVGDSASPGNLKLYGTDGSGNKGWYDQVGGSSPPFLISDITGLQAYIDELVAARGDRSQLNLRISTISNFASPNAGGVVVGLYYDNSFQGTASTTLASAANRINLAPFYTSTPLRIDQLGIAVSTAGAGAARCVIYDSDASGWPDNLLLTVDQSDTGTTGWRGGACDFTFDSGRQYWLGVHTAGAPTYRAINVSSAVNLGISGNNATSYYSMLRRTVTYASGAPDPWAFVSTDLVTGNPPSIRMRATAL